MQVEVLDREYETGKGNRIPFIGLAAIWMTLSMWTMQISKSLNPYSTTVPVLCIGSIQCAVQTYAHLVGRDISILEDPVGRTLPSNKMETVVSSRLAHRGRWCSHGPQAAGRGMENVISLVQTPPGVARSQKTSSTDC
jgi:hypothetical protein